MHASSIRREPAEHDCVACAPYRQPPGPRAYQPPRVPQFCSEEKPRCVCGGRVRTAHRPSTDGTLTCDHRPARGAPPCGRLLWVALFTFGGSATIRGAGERVWCVVEITPGELRELQARPMTFLEKLAFLRCTLPGVDEDLVSLIEQGALGVPPR